MVVWEQLRLRSRNTNLAVSPHPGNYKLLVSKFHDFADAFIVNGRIAYLELANIGGRIFMLFRKRGIVLVDEKLA